MHGAIIILASLFSAACIKGSRRFLWEVAVERSARIKLVTVGGNKPVATPCPQQFQHAELNLWNNYFCSVQEAKEGRRNSQAQQSL